MPVFLLRGGFFVPNKNVEVLYYIFFTYLEVNDVSKDTLLMMFKHENCIFLNKTKTYEALKSEQMIVTQHSLLESES